MHLQICPKSEVQTLTNLKKKNGKLKKKKKMKLFLCNGQKRIHILPLLLPAIVITAKLYNVTSSTIGQLEPNQSTGKCFVMFIFMFFNVIVFVILYCLY